MGSGAQGCLGAGLLGWLAWGRSWAPEGHGHGGEDEDDGGREDGAADGVDEGLLVASQIVGLAMPIVGPHGTALLLADPAGRLMAHHLIDDPGWDAGVLQPGREGVAGVVGAVEVDRLQQGVLGTMARLTLADLTTLTIAGCSCSNLPTT